MELPQLPVPIDRFLQYTSKCANRSELNSAVAPFKAYESKLREIYAQYPDHPTVKQNHLIPIFAPGNPHLTIKARDINGESAEIKDQYLLPLDSESRRKDGTDAIVKNLSDFRTNFNLFCESSLVDLDWSNVIAAGSSVVTSLLPVDAPHNESKRALRTYYNQTLAPASDVDLFIYGLNEEQAIEKIKQIESRIRDSILSETTTIRTKNAITIVSEYPTRHVQIVLRLYKSPSEILSGFDVDCSCVAYDGQQVWTSPRAMTAFMTQVNTVDLSRRSPSYENRLSKYSHRGFEVFWPALNRERIDPTIYERSFSRVMGLARLLVLEKLPHPNDRDAYLAKRREERGRAPLPWNLRSRHQLPGNVKESQPDDVAEWVQEEDISDYHTFTVPYGPKYNAKQIEKLLFTKDLLLNAEWNRSKDRETVLHRHPAFFGAVQDVISDCCGFCPKAETDADLAAYEKESKIYVSGQVQFMKDDPGRQAIGSFHPITDDDWTEMAYVGNTTRLCQAIVDADLEAVEDWFSSGDPNEVLDVNRRDHTGRTPLLLATMASTPEIVQYLIDHGARLVSRLYNGLTALHIAAYRGETEMVRMILEKSAANAAEEDRKDEARKAARRAASSQSNEVFGDADIPKSEQVDDYGDSDELDDLEEDDDESSDDLTEGEFVKISNKDNALEDDVDEPDVYDIDVLAWDQPMGPLHMAIIASNVEVVKLLINEYGADVLLPVKILAQHGNREPEAAILTLILALEAPLNKARNMISTLLSNGAMITQADMKERSALHYAVKNAKAVIFETMTNDIDSMTLKKAVNHVSIGSINWYQKQVEAPILTAIRTRDATMVDQVLRMGASVKIDYESYANASLRMDQHASNRTADDTRKEFQKTVEQPVILAAKLEMPEVALRLIRLGADVNTLSKGAWNWLEGRNWGTENRSLLDIVRDRIKSLGEFIADKEIIHPEKPEPLPSDESCLDSYPKDSYQHWMAIHDLFQAKIVKKAQMQDYEDQLKLLHPKEEDGTEQKRKATKETIAALKTLEKEILENGGKTFYELHPDALKVQENVYYDHIINDTTINKSQYATHFSFDTLALTEEKKKAYIDLFEAAWTGDIDTVKRLCSDSEKPLQVATKDLANFSPFTIAVLRGHEQLASIILEIAAAQYEPSEEDRYRYRLKTAEPDEDDYDSDESSLQDDEDHPRLSRDIIKDNFTVDDVTALAAVKSKVSPLTVLEGKSSVWRASSGNPKDAMETFGLSSSEVSWYPVYFNGQTFDKSSWPWFHSNLPQERGRCNQSLIRYAIVKNDVKMLCFLLKLGQDLLSRKDGDDDASKIYDIDDDDFNCAIRSGRLELISEIIKLTGHGMPLNKLMENSGVKLDEKPRYYQGLSVYGKKRKDWAARGQGRHTPVRESDDAPLLKTVFEGNLETVEYYLSDGPINRYKDFARAYQNDKRIQGLANAQGGIDKALGSWLGMRSYLALHMSVMSKPCADGNRLLEYLLPKMTQEIDTKSSTGLTPLQLAFELARIETAKMLIAAGADQTTRKDTGDNILHTVFSSSTLANPRVLPSVLGLLDPQLIQPLLVEKTSSPEPGSMTPLALYLSKFAGDSNVISVLRIVLEHSKGADLEIMNGAGDYILHTVVRNGNNKVIRFLAEYRPEMLYWENATGLTPIDIAQIAWLRNVVEQPPQIDASNHYSIVDQDHSSFVKKELTDDENELYKVTDDNEQEFEKGRRPQWYTYRLLLKLSEKFPSKRKLVSVFDANEVAKRLAKQQQKLHAEIRRQERLGVYTPDPRYRAQFPEYSEDHGRSQVATTKYLNEHGCWVSVKDTEDEVMRWKGAADDFPKVDLLKLEKELQEQ